MGPGATEGAGDGSGDLMGGPSGPSSALPVLREFLRLGIIGFGGPSAHLALFRRRFVHELGWLSEQTFLDLLGTANLLPGPTSTEVALAIGQTRAGWRGLLAAGFGFIGPAAITVLVLAIGYERFGSQPAVGWLLYGIQPVVVAIVALAVAGMAPVALKGLFTWAIAGVVVAALLLGVDPLLLIVGGGVAGLAWRGVRRGASGLGGAMAAAVVNIGRGVPGPVSPSGLRAFVLAVATGTIGLPSLFVLFLKIGLLSFGSGYVLVAFLHADLVQGLGLLTDRQLLDAVAVGQVTPGPVYTAATFIGYLLAGVPGAVVATVAILPYNSVHPFVPRLRASPVAAALLDGVNAASLGLMAAVTVQLARATVVDALTLVLVVGAFAALLRWPRAAVPLMVVGGVVGLGAHAVPFG